MKKGYILLIALAVIAVATMCKKPFEPKVSDAETNILVVEGTINTGPDSTIVRLSRTIKLSQVNNNYSTANPEKGAAVTVEDDQNKIIGLTEGANGTYGSAGLNLPSDRKYRLRIRTSDGVIYLSNFEAVKNAPPIDSVGHKVSANNLTIYANAHDATNNTRYYRWEFDETYKFHALYQSEFETDGAAIIPRLNSVYECFGFAKSSTISLSSTAKLTKDEVFQEPISVIASTEEKIGIRYSILVKQYALTKEAYEFWSNIKRNTESLGSVFDAQPSAPVGNIKCISNTSLPVIGFVSVGRVQTKRVFIDKAELPSQWRVKYPYGCGLDSMFFSNPRTRFNDVDLFLIPRTSTLIPVTKFQMRAADAGYLASARLCADCTVRGTQVQPPFWK